MDGKPFAGQEREGAIKPDSTSAVLVAAGGRSSKPRDLRRIKPPVVAAATFGGPLEAPFVQTSLRRGRRFRCKIAVAVAASAG